MEPAFQFRSALAVAIVALVELVLLCAITMPDHSSDESPLADQQATDRSDGRDPPDTDDGNDWEWAESKSYWGCDIRRDWGEAACSTRVQAACATFYPIQLFMNGGWYGLYDERELGPQETLQLYREIGATKVVDILGKLYSLFPEGQPAETNLELCSQMSAAEKKNSERVEALENEFVGASDEVYPRLRRFWYEERARGLEFARKLPALAAPRSRETDVAWCQRCVKLVDQMRAYQGVPEMSEPARTVWITWYIREMKIAYCRNVQVNRYGLQLLREAPDCYERIGLPDPARAVQQFLSELDATRHSDFYSALQQMPLARFAQLEEELRVPDQILARHLRPYWTAQTRR